ncbi:MAG: hypothetical protein DRP09_20320 [Candidatus Thorarchaeota archaeon]|nr:MAG: hypothetical protein DRP09_20320 [Candidatus Thorarchaeota archaeon]
MSGMYKRDCYAVSEVIGILFVLIIATTAISSITIWSNIRMSDQKSTIRVENLLEQFNTFDGFLNEMVGEGVNSSRIFAVTADEGQISITSYGTRFVFCLPHSTYNCTVSGFSLNDLDYSDNINFNFYLYNDSPTLNFSLYSLGNNTKLEYYLNSSPPTVSNNWYEYSVSFNHLINGAVRIDIYNETSGVFIAELFVIDVGSLTYETQSNSGNSQVIVENGGIVFGRPGSYYLINEPTVYNSDGALVLRILQIQPGSEMGTNIGGGATYRFFTKIVKNDILYLSDDMQYSNSSFKMQIFGDYADAWISYFTTRNNYFDQYDSSSFDAGTLHVNNTYFTLAYSIYTLDLRVI